MTAGLLFRLAAYRGVARRAEGSLVSSRQLGVALGVNETQVRRDVEGIGVRGKRGVGYRVADVIRGVSRAVAAHPGVLEAEIARQGGLLRAVVGDDMATIRNFLDWTQAINGSFATNAMHRALVRENRPKPSLDDALAALARIEGRA